MIDTLNDIYSRDNPLASATIDARDFFPTITLAVVFHNDSGIFNDMRAGRANHINLSHKLTLFIKKPQRKNLEDLYNKSKYTNKFSFLGSKRKVIRLNPLSIIAELPTLDFNTIDIRGDEHYVSKKLYTDIYSFPLPIRKRVQKILRKNKKRIAV